jgi:hypothetical protein
MPEPGMIRLPGWLALCVAASLLVACGSPGTLQRDHPRVDAGPSRDVSITPSPDGTAVDAPRGMPAPDVGSPTDAAMAAEMPIAGCGEFSGDTTFTCSMDGNSRGECLGTTPTIEACPRGCLREKPPTDAVCMGTTDTWSCTGSYGTQRAQNGDYYITSFGCWVDPSMTVHTDPGDNCIPSCLSQAKASGLCNASDDGPSCEEKITWFTADGARFGCLQRLRVTNVMTGKSVIAVALDFGPSCSVEASVSKAVLDTSGRIDLELFGGDQGASDRSLVHVVEVDNSTPLGPVP